jgi:hypothetical protein
MNRFFVILALTICSFLAACDSTSTPTNPTTPTNPNNPSGKKQMGAVSLFGSGITGIDNWTGAGQFLETTVDPINIYEGTDLCVAGGGNTAPTDPREPEQNAVYLEAGESITLRSGSSTYATFNKKVDSADGRVLYTITTNNLLPEPPASVTVDIPGLASGFPAFSGVAFPPLPAPLTFSASPSLQAINKSSTFSWTGSSDGAIFFLGAGQNAAGQPVVFVCFAKDDGSHTFPATTQAQLDTAGFTTGTLNYATRVTSRVEKKGNATLFLYMFRSATFPLSF